MTDFKREMDGFIGEDPRFTEDLKRKILQEAKTGITPGAQKKFGFSSFKYAAVLILLLLTAGSFLFISLQDSGGQGGADVITDSETTAEIEVFTQYEAPLELFDYGGDAMDRGNHDYYTYPLLIDPLAYESEEVSRGDVIVYEAEFFDGSMNQTISRVVGLPGETVEIREGQICVDGRKLDTFYGRAHRLGFSSSEAYDEALKEEGALQNVGSMEEVFSQSAEPIELKENEVFLAGDDWLRSERMVLPLSAIEGKVLGYYK